MRINVENGKEIGRFIDMGEKVKLITDGKLSKEVMYYL